MASTSPPSPSSNPIRSVFNGVQTQASRWFRHISEAAEAYKARDGKNRRSDSSGPSMPLPTPDSEAPDSSQEKTKDSDETASEAVKEPPGGVSQDVEPTLTGENTPSESASTTPQASPSSVVADSGEPLTRKMVIPRADNRVETSVVVHKDFGLAWDWDWSGMARLCIVCNVEHGAPPPGDGLLSPSPGTQRRRVEPLRLTTEESPLIQPSEVVVSQRPVLTAEPVLTPIEQLRRKDEAIRLALAEKQQLVADILHVPREEFENIAELAGEPSLDKEATELVLAAVNQANQLTTILNNSLHVTEEETVSAMSETVSGRRVERLPSVPAHKLQGISTALNTHLSAIRIYYLMCVLQKIIKDRDEERERLRRELQRSREQLHAMHESQRRSQVSRPSSLVSSEDDTGWCLETHCELEAVLSPGLHRSSLRDDEVADMSEQSTDKHLAPDPHDDTGPDVSKIQHQHNAYLYLQVFVDALSGEAEAETQTKAAAGLDDV
ncbi:hypothetical protein ANN_18951 [Periplaneta americana]|uniref:Uncharacterized protein n=1 Tax=Periplaneta americana TaxID=6978 RepID=A0ABQ8SSB9_PERAM|nr:hypothetical protein ANN_18951 [Periplaneta americana]